MTLRRAAAARWAVYLVGIEGNRSRTTAGAVLRGLQGVEMASSRGTAGSRAFTAVSAVAKLASMAVVQLVALSACSSVPAVAPQNGALPTATQSVPNGSIGAPMSTATPGLKVQD